jgi:predicted ATPase/DNA-binding SARP family transcriptional activator
VRVGLLGPVEVRDDAGGQVAVPGSRLRALLVRLALAGGRPVSGDDLIDAVWGAVPPAGALNALQTLVSRLRRTLPGLTRTEAGYRLVGVEVDVDVFERLAAGARASRDAGDLVAARAQLTEALALWRGDPPDEVAPRLVEARLRAVEDLAESEVALGAADEVADRLAGLVAAHPVRERLVAAHMRALVAAGRPAQALTVYEDLRRGLAAELGADPSPQVRELHAAILRGEAAAPARPRAAVTSFVGREADLDRLRQLLKETRLVTLVGPGGAGKTRLAGAVADGAWWVELSDVADPDRVPATVLGALGLRQAGLPGAARAGDPLATLTTGLGDRDVVLVLDNCEHLIDACARLADRVLAECPRVRIVATSREPLGIGGEFLHPVGPLAVPPEAEGWPDAAGYPAVRLFADRAAAARSGFRVTPDNLADVAEICRRLDGLPLAIEMAATRLRSMPLAEVAARLSDRFRLLTGGNRTALPRHQTLLAVVDWSWRLLTEAERAVARGLAVFAGGATLPAARAVCGAGVDDVLGGLVEKSFVQLLDGRPPWYRMLDTIGAFAAGELAAAGEASRVRQAHAAYFLALAEEAEPNLRGAAQLHWLAELDREYGNLSAALRWAVDSADTPTALRLAAALGWYWSLRDVHDEAATWLRRVLALPEAPVPPGTLATVHAYNAMYHGESDPARSHAAIATAHRLAGGDRRAWPAAVAFMALVLSGPDDDLAAHPDPWVAAQAELVAGQHAAARGDVAATAHHYAAAHEKFTAAGDRWGVATAADRVAGIHSLHGRHEQAVAAATRALELTELVGAAADAAWLRAQRGRYRLRAGDLPGARADLVRARAEAEENGTTPVVLAARIALATLARRTGQPSDITTVLADVTGDGWMENHLRLTALLEAARTAGDRTLLAEAFELAGTHIAAGPATAEVAEALASLTLADGDPQGAARLLSAATALRGVPDAGDPDVADLLTAPGNPTSTMDTETARAVLAHALRR